jgi:uncharacterized protein (TIGR02757 family)
MKAEDNSLINLSEIKAFLEEKTEQYNHPRFIETDPVKVPRQYTQKEDIEISAFLTAIISWGNRTSIIKNALRLMTLMDNRPYEFITDASPSEYNRLNEFIHRTFNGTDCLHLVHSLKNIYTRHGGLQQVIENAYLKGGTIKFALASLHTTLFEVPGERTRKHIANVENGASAKRLNMFMRWMVRSDTRGVDFGLWPAIPPSSLMLPLDVHTGNVARKLGLLKRKQNDWKAVEEVTQTLRIFDNNDPVKYDFALFGLGIFERF